MEKKSVPKQRLALNRDGKGFSLCNALPANFGKPPCIHIDHQMDGETPEEFIKRVEWNPARDNPIIGKPWNQKAFKECEDMLEKYNKVCLVQGTGLGKSAVLCAIADEHRDRRMLFCTPSSNLIDDMRSYHFGLTARKPVQLVTYAALCNMSDEELKQYDMLLLDEVHHVAEKNKCLEKIKVCMDAHPDLLLVGATATNVRTSGVDVADELFDGHIAGGVDVGTAWDNGYLTRPRIVEMPFAKTAPNKLIEQIQLAMKGKWVLNGYMNEVNEAYEGMNPEKQHAIIVDELEKKIEKNIQFKEPTKILVFCHSVDGMPEVREEMQPLINKAAEKYGLNVEAHQLVSADNKKATQKVLSHVAENDDSVQVLYLFDKINEGMHVNGVNVEIQARPTDSSIKYHQQLGRIMHKNDENPSLLLDLAGNTSKHSTYDHAGKNPEYVDVGVKKFDVVLNKLEVLTGKWSTVDKNGNRVSLRKVYEYYEQQGYQLSSHDKTLIKKQCSLGTPMEDIIYRI